MEVMTLVWGYGRRWIGSFSILLQPSSSETNTCNITIGNFLRRSDKEWVIGSPVIPADTLRKKREIKTMLDLTRLPCSMVTRRSLNWLNRWSIEKTLLMWIVRIALRKNRELKKCWGIEEGSVSEDCKNDFMNK